MERGEKSPDDLNRPEWNSLEDNYEKHDVGHEAFVRRITDAGYVVHSWGIDMREDDGNVIYDDAMDFKVWSVEPTTLVLRALVDVKTKSRAYYMGEFNERHYTKYYGHADEYPVPIFVVFFQLDGETIEDECVFRVDQDEMYDGVWTTSNDDLETFPDGNAKAEVKPDYRLTWEQMIEQL